MTEDAHNTEKFICVLHGCAACNECAMDFQRLRAEREELKDMESFWKAENEHLKDQLEIAVEALEFIKDVTPEKGAVHIQAFGALKKIRDLNKQSKIKGSGDGE